jgi:hypothetical protein
LAHNFAILGLNYAQFSQLSSHWKGVA